jgi:hypothetical protein
MNAILRDTVTQSNRLSVAKRKNNSASKTVLLNNTDYSNVRPWNLTLQSMVSEILAKEINI